MARERQSYRAILEQLNTAFPGVGAISLAEAAAFYGVSVRTLQRDKTFPRAPHGRVILVDFARWMAV